MVAIIGGGPAGAYLAYLLAKAGKKVSVFEEHKQVGLPVQCSGVVTGKIEEVVPMRKQFIVNKIDHFRIFSPNKDYVDIKFNKPNFVLDRKEFDRYLIEEARRAGAKIYLGRRFNKAKKINHGYHLEFDRGSFDYNKIVGADGCYSSVAKNFGLYGKREFVTGVQARMSLETDAKIIEVWFNKDYFGWVIPEDSKVCRVGVLANKNPNIHFKKFLEMRVGRAKVREYQSGLIPIYNPSLRIQKGKVYLIGDAATQVKASSYGGLIYGLQAAEELSKVLINGRGDYTSKCKRRFGRELRYNLKVRKILNKFSNEDYNYLIKLMKQKRVKKVLEKHDRDEMGKALIKLALKEPRFVKFVRKMF